MKVIRFIAFTIAAIAFAVTLGAVMVVVTDSERDAWAEDCTRAGGKVIKVGHDEWCRLHGRMIER